MAVLNTNQLITSILLLTVVVAGTTCIIKSGIDENTPDSFKSFINNLLSISVLLGFKIYLVLLLKILKFF